MSRKLISVLAIFLVGLSVQATANAPRVLVTIKPLEFIAAAITDGITTPKLLLQPGISPHDYSLRPSDIRSLAAADLVFWIGEDLETFLVSPLNRHVDKNRAIALMDAPNITVASNTLKNGEEDVRRTLEKISHSNHEPHHHDHGHSHGDHDPHIWLSPDNARAIAHTMMTALTEVDRTHASRYQNNYLSFIDQLRATDAVNKGVLAGVQDQGFFVFHNAWGYFTRHYGLRVIDTFTLNPEQLPGARHMVKLRNELESAGETCVFREPQFQPAYLDTLVKNLPKVRIGVIDPMGSEIKTASDAYPKFLEHIAATVRGCLTNTPPGR